MKRKMPNAQRRTPNAQVRKQRTLTRNACGSDSVFNVERSAFGEPANSNYGARNGRRYDLEEKLLDVVQWCLNEIEELVRIFTARVKTAERNAKL